MHDSRRAYLALGRALGRIPASSFPLHQVQTPKGEQYARARAKRAAQCEEVRKCVGYGARYPSVNYRTRVRPLLRIRCHAMPQTFCLYLDDSGSRHPDHRAHAGPAKPDWFALGGVLVDEDAVPEANSLIDEFRARWPEMRESPLHSAEIRSRKGGFRWLESTREERRRAFMEDLTGLMLTLPIVAVGCVIDRPGYNARYAEKYGKQRWQLCRTAFSIAVERSAKFARHHGGRLRVYVENSDRPTEKRLKGYFDEMRSVGLPFDPSTSSAYAPLKNDDLSACLMEFKVKTKSSKLMQIADVALWPICKGGYDPATLPYVALRDAGKLIDAHCTATNGLLGVKYSCFEAPNVV